MTLRIDQIVVTYPKNEYIRPVYIGALDSTATKLCRCANQVLFCGDCNKIISVKNITFTPPNRESNGSSSLPIPVPRRNTDNSDHDFPYFGNDERSTDEEIENKPLQMNRSTFDYEAHLGNS